MLPAGSRGFYTTILVSVRLAVNSIDSKQASRQALMIVFVAKSACALKHYRRS